MKVVVLGGAGLTGRCAVRDLIRSPKVSEVVVADIDEARARKFASSLKSNKITHAIVDVRNHSTTAALLKDADVALNMVQYYFNLDVMKSALIAKVHYLDLGGLYHTT